MSAKIKWQILNAALLFGLVFCGYGLTIYFDRSNLPPKPEEVLTLIPVPEFTFTDLTGKSHALQDFKGKIVIINFWATWCAPCVAEFPALLKIAANNPRDVVLIALSSDMDEDAIKTFLEKQKPLTSNVHVALDSEDITHKIYNIDKLPETTITDRALNARQTLIGAEWEPAMLQKIIDSL